MKTVINPPEMAAPTGYSYAIKKKNDVAAQVEQVFANLRTVVGARGGSIDDVVKITVYVTDPSYRPAVAAARQRHFKEGQYPASTYLVVSALAVPQLLVEIEAVAMVG